MLHFRGNIVQKTFTFQMQRQEFNLENLDNNNSAASNSDTWAITKAIPTFVQYFKICAMDTFDFGNSSVFFEQEF
jgi:hypothetical protein